MSAHTLPECYEVTSDGRVISFTKWRGIDTRELEQHPNDDGYLCVRVVINGRRRRMAVHQLVARTHHGSQPAPGYEVRHLDGNKLNNNYKNLAWGTRKENADDRAQHGRTSCGAKHSAAIVAALQPARNRGKPLSESHKAKLRAEMAGKPWSDARRNANVR